MNYAVLVATRNRPKTLGDLLKSLEVQVPSPRQIIVVSSGDDISLLLRKFKQLPITHRHLDESGQMRQKKAGITLIEKGIEWVLFIDDDCALHEQAIANLSSFILKSEDINIEIDKVRGIGLRIIEPGVNLKRRQHRIGVRKLGKVSRSGKAFNYMHSDQVIETFWLNGVSIWRSDSLINYNFPLTKSRYAYSEDLIFSYSVSKTGRLMYYPDSICYMQLPASYSQKSFEILQSVLFWRYYFVASNTDLSPVLMYLDLFKIALLFLLRNPQSRSRHVREISKALFIILQALLLRKNPRVVLEEVEWFRGKS